MESVIGWTLEEALLQCKINNLGTKIIYNTKVYEDTLFVTNCVFFNNIAIITVSNFKQGKVNNVF